MGKQVKKFWSARFCLLALLFLFPVYLSGCGEKDPFPVFPAPEITTLTPSAGRLGSDNLEIIVSGTGFNETSVLNFKGTDLPTTFVNAGEIRARVPHSLMSTLGSAAVFVKNHLIAGGDSKSAFFQILNYQFTVPVNVSSTPAAASFDPSIGVDASGTIHLVWVEDLVVFYSRSTDDGATFSPAFPLVPGVQSQTPQVFVDDSDIIHVVWVDDWDVFYSRSEDGGVSFSAGLNLSNTALLPLVTPTSGFSATPSVTVDGTGTIHVVWEEDFTILYSRSSDGISFTPGQSLIFPTGFSINPSIAREKTGEIHVVWDDDNFIYHSFSTNGGGVFSAGQLISDVDSLAETPDVAVDNFNGVQVVWQSSGVIYQGISLDGGETFFAGVDISSLDSDFDSTSPAVSVDKVGNVHVLWDEFKFSDGSLVVKHSVSTDFGLSFPDGRIVSTPSDAALTPAVAADESGDVFVAWWGGPPGVLEILFSKGE